MSPEVTTKSDFVAIQNLDTGEWCAVPESLQVSAFGATDIGQRSSNQDQFAIARLVKLMEVTQSSFDQPDVKTAHEQAHLFVVADGIGGHVGGEEASQLAVAAVQDFLLDTLRWFFCLPAGEQDHVLKEFQQGVGQADARLFSEGQENPKLRGMGTTLTMAFLLGNQLFIAHAGDSRCYIFREAKLYQLTSDHTFVAKLVEEGVLDPEEAEQSRFANVITNSLGGSEQGVRVDVHKLQAAAGDVLLLCTDGLSKEVDDRTIATTLQSHPQPRTASEKLVAMAKEHGGMDNITAIIVQLNS